MGKFKSYLLFVTAISVSAIAQNKTIVPKSGTVVFACKASILDQQFYNDSKKAFSENFIESMKKSIVMERQLEGEIVDTAKINQVIKGSAGAMIGLMESELFKDKSGYTYHHEYKDGILTQYKSKNDNQEDLLTINTKTRMFSNDFTEAYYDFAKNNIIDIKEYKNEVKLINNFKCFKVVYSYTEGDSEEEQLPYFAELMNGYKYTREMWVTDRIKSEFHPLVKDKEILTKYYPLEITEYSDMTKGMIDKYELVTLQLN